MSSTTTNQEQLDEWRKSHDGTLSTTIRRRVDDKEDTVDVTLLRLPPKNFSHKLAGLGKITPPGVGFVFFLRNKKDVLSVLSKEDAASMFKKSCLNLKNNVKEIEHPDLGTIFAPVIPETVFKVREERRKVKDDSTAYWQAIGTTRHSAPMNSHSLHPARKDLKKLKSRSLHKAWSEFKQSQYCMKFFFFYSSVFSDFYCIQFN